MVFKPGSKDHKSINSLLIPLFNPWILLNASMVAIVASTSEPCCNKACKLPLVKFFSTDAAHGLLASHSWGLVLAP